MAETSNTPTPSTTVADPSSSSAAAAQTTSSTVYINNLNERVKLDVLKQSLSALFSTYGSVLSITAHGNLRMRGQAFVAFDDSEIAAKAIQEVNGFPLYGKAMQLSFAKTPSDSVVIKKTGSSDTPEYQQHKTERLARKASEQEKRSSKGRKSGDASGKRKRGEEGEDDVDAAASGAAAKKAPPQIPDEYLPPNPILFIQNLPEADASFVPREELESLFSAYPNLLDVRTIPNNATIAFVEFASADDAARARDGLNGTRLGSQKGRQDVRGIRITFARA